MPQDYVYDIFVSYRRKPPVLDWVRNHFYPLLSQWLPNFAPMEPRIFIDELQIETGSAWPAKLAQALRSSRYLVAIWSPEYFRSRWCVAEWQTMRKCEQLLGLGTAHNPDGLVYPIKFSDGEYFPPEAKQTQQKDLQEWNCPHLSYRETAGIVVLDKQVQIIAQELVSLLQKAPPWQEDWPIVTPEPDSYVAVPLPRLS